MLKKKIALSILLITLFSVFSCKDEVLPKPASYLRLDYPVASYVPFENQCPFKFEMNSDAIIKGEKECQFTINYPNMKATIYLTYKPVQNNIQYLLRDAQKLRSPRHRVQQAARRRRRRRRRRLHHNHGQ